MIKKIMSHLLIACIASFTTVYFMQSQTYSSEIIKRSNTELYDIDTLVYALNDLSQSPSSEITRNRIESLVIRKIITVSALKPDINKLQGTPIRALRHLIYYVDTIGFIASDSLGLGEKAAHYLNSIRDEVASRSNRPQAMFKKSIKESLQKQINKRELKQ